MAIWSGGAQSAAEFTKVAGTRYYTVIPSDQGRYYVGRTGVFHVPAGQEALVIFDNPSGSGRRAMVAAITLTSNHGRRAFFYFDATSGARKQKATRVANAHRGVPDKPKVAIKFVARAGVSLRGGIDVFERLLEGQVTLNTEQEGRYIFEPGHSITVLFPAIDAKDEIDVAYGWWEEPLR